MSAGRVDGAAEEEIRRNPMASRPHTTYKKRQKELQRLEKQRDKVVRRQQRKAGLLPADTEEEPSSIADLIAAEDANLPETPSETDAVARDVSQ